MNSIQEPVWGLESVKREQQEKNLRALANQQCAYLREGQLPPRGRSRMVTIHDGVAQVWGNWTHFEASLSTDEGNEVVQSWQAPGNDIQSGPSSEWRAAIESLDEAIRSAYGTRRPLEAITEISLIWEHLDRTGELAAARSHLLMGKVEKPKLARLPKWFEEQEPRLGNEEEAELAPNPLAIESARLLVRASLAAVGETQRFEAELEAGPLGRVIIDWYFPGSRLQWMVEANDLPWPSVKVYELSRRSGHQVPEPPRTRILHNAFDVVESFTDFVQGK